MKIVIITPYYAPAWAYGGPPKVLSVLSDELVRKGHSVTVITTNALDIKRNSIAYEMMHGVNVFRTKLFSNTLAYKLKIFYVPNLLQDTKHLIDSADIVLFSDVRSILNWQLFEYVYQKKIRYGVFAYGQIPYGNDWKSPIKKIFDILWVRRFMSHATWCFAQTDHEKAMYREFFHIKSSAIRVLPLPIVISKKTTRRVPHVDFEKYGIHSKDRIILFVGRFHHLKGVDILIKASISIIRKNKNFKLVLIGRDDGALDALRQMVPEDIKSSILFPGPVYGDAVKSWHSRATCFVFTPRYYEETSTAALEALSNGCPVVTVHESEIPFLSEYNAGVIVQNRIPLIQKAIQYVVSKHTVMSRNTRKLIVDHYDIKKIVMQLMLCA